MNNTYNTKIKTFTIKIVSTQSRVMLLLIVND